MKLMNWGYDDSSDSLINNRIQSWIVLIFSWALILICFYPAFIFYSLLSKGFLKNINQKKLKYIN